MTDDDLHHNDDPPNTTSMAPLNITTPDADFKNHQQHTKLNNAIQKQCIYIVVLLLVLSMVGFGGNVGQHEPSVRIFRALSEATLLLLCTSGCIFVWTRFLGIEETERLLFYLPQGNLTGENAVHQHEDDHDFDDVHEDDMFSDERSKQRIVNTAESSHHIPSSAVLLSGALNLVLWILVTLFLYALAASEATDIHSNWRFLSQIAAPTFPLLLFVYCAFKAVYPFRNRAILFQVLSFTLWAPSYSVSFRDGMIGDVLTSTVRPLQDIAFTTCYILFGLQGWWWSSSWTTMTDSNFLAVADANVPSMERSWLLHTLILPACMISPLWYRFLQNMRQVYDNKQRWPYLGNAWKYFVAAQVAMVGVYHPNVKSNPIWLLSFALATLYQIWWDVVMDWGLLVGNGRNWRLRERRLYPSKAVYWGLVVVNALLRFCWTLNFVPTRYLSVAGVLMREDGAALLGPLIASAEIVRRSLWALLRVEWESVKDSSSSNAVHEGTDDNGLMIPMELPGATAKRNVLLFFKSDLSSVADAEVLGELCLYTSTFAVLGVVIAAHRGTM